MEDSLTRHIIIEKTLWFANYNHPKNVPNEIWEKATINMEELSSIESMLEYIAEMILAPILGEDRWVISPMIYDPTTFSPMKRITFSNICRLSGYMHETRCNNRVGSFFHEELITARAILFEKNISWNTYKT